jgi:ABC-type lipoprotein export system ATPase subunit
VNAIELRDVFRVHSTPEGDAAALQGLSLAVREREVVAVLGPSGSGKSTLLRLLAGVERPSAGSVRVLGEDVGKLSSRRVAAYRATSLGYVDQHYARALAPELSARELVALQLGLRGAPDGDRLARADELLERVGLAAKRSRRPAQLSGGEQQRVALCAALAHRPQVLLADEPTGELDAATAAQVYDLVGELVREQGCTTVLVSHDPESARVADRIVRIRDGRVSEEWTRDEEETDTIVIGRGGWLRLPEELLLRAGIGERATARLESGGIVVTPTASAARGDSAAPGGSADSGVAGASADPGVAGASGAPRQPASPSAASAEHPSVRAPHPQRVNMLTWNDGDAGGAGPPRRQDGEGVGSPPGGSESLPGSSAVMRVRGLAKRYGETRVLDGLDAEFRGGLFYAVTGPSGSGKTTLLHLLAGLELPDAGTIDFGGSDLAALDRTERAARRAAGIAYVGQQSGLVPHLSALENIELALALRGVNEPRGRALPALEAVGLSDRVGQRVGRLSQGEQARVAIARAVAARPSLLLADEPTSRLDGANAIAVAHLLARLARDTGAAVLCATHDRLVVEQADRELDLDL